VFVVIAILAVCGIAMFQIVAYLERRLIFWASQELADQQ
jgi:ABC-type nitrate/sulfonate/bicarbonate transport system permease component